MRLKWRAINVNCRNALLRLLRSNVYAIFLTTKRKIFAICNLCFKRRKQGAWHGAEVGGISVTFVWFSFREQRIKGCHGKAAAAAAPQKAQWRDAQKKKTKKSKKENSFCKAKEGRKAQRPNSCSCSCWYSNSKNWNMPRIAANPTHQEGRPLPASWQTLPYANKPMPKATHSSPP